jgi:rhomboid protease GluP
MKWLRRLPEAPVTSALILANLAIYVWMAIDSGMPSGFNADTMTYFGVNIVGTSQAVSHWRWLTAAFIHFNLLHIGMNMWVLTQIGVISERTIGSGVVAAAYVITGVFGNVATTTFNGWRHHFVASAGASSAIMGLIGLAAAYAWRTQQKGMARSLAMNLVFVLVLGYFLNLDNAAHVGGFVSGALIGALRARWPQRLPRWLDATLIGASAVVSIAAFAIIRAYHGYH